ncbi:S-adenosyl-L-methionine-dependent methyltransferase [Trinorchestia longiramus]|nr:S-adenosyl-L-methionine-dependent methyltransferase [Trinorchestia longiramus]
MFCFNFSVADEDSNCSNGVLPKPSPPAATLHWQPAQMFQVSRQDWQALLSEPAVLEEQTFGNVQIKYLGLDFISDKLESSNKVSAAIKQAEEEYSDLIPAVYEGGLRVWECTWDLLRLLHTTPSLHWPGKRVLELGCGAGLLGIYAFLCGASVTFQDYNMDVIEQVTVPNVLYNAADLSATVAGEEEKQDGEEAIDASLALQDKTLQALEQRVRFCYGDWGDLPQLLESSALCPTTEVETVKLACEDDAHTAGNNNNSSSSCYDARNDSSCREANLDESRKPSSRRSCDLKDCADNCTMSEKFDFILTSETIYNQDNYEKLLDIFTSCLQPEGVVLLAAKSCYFGVGGSVASFIAAVERTGRLQHRKLFEHITGVRREIIEIKLLE